MIAVVYRRATDMMRLAFVFAHCDLERAAGDAAELAPKDFVPVSWVRPETPMSVPYDAEYDDRYGTKLAAMPGVQEKWRRDFEASMKRALGLRREDDMPGGTRIDQTAVIGHPPEHREWRDAGAGECLAPEIHPTVRVEAYVTVDAGVDTPTRVGEGSWLLKHSHVGHDAQVGRNVTVATGAIVGGYARVDDDAHIGLNATVQPYRRVGAGALVDAGSVVYHDVPPGARVRGNPAVFAGLRGERHPLPYSERRKWVAGYDEAGDPCRDGAQLVEDE